MKQQTQTPDTTKQKELHTQGEWEVHSTGLLDHKFEIHPKWDEDGEHPIADIHLMEGQTIEECQANAELIVKAVNERQALLDSQKELKGALTELLADVLDLLKKNDSIKLGTMGTIHIVRGQEALKNSI